MKDEAKNGKEVVMNVINRNLEAAGPNGVTSYLNRWLIHEQDHDTAVCRLTWRQVSKLMIYIGHLSQALYAEATARREHR